MILPLVIAVAAAPQAVAAEDPRVTAALAALPPNLAGLPRRWPKGRDGSIAMYLGGPADPLIIVSISAYDTALDDELLRGVAILALGGDKSKARFEGPFVAPAKQGAKGFFGEYGAEKYHREIWVLQHDGVLMVVSAKLPHIEDRQRIRDTVMRDLFGDAGSNP